MAAVALYALRESVLGDARRELRHRYRGQFKAGELHFVQESSGSESPHDPVEFIARRISKWRPAWKARQLAICKMHAPRAAWIFGSSAYRLEMPVFIGLQLGCIRPVAHSSLLGVKRRALRNTEEIYASLADQSECAK